MEGNANTQGAVCPLLIVPISVREDETGVSSVKERHAEAKSTPWNV